MSDLRSRLRMFFCDVDLMGVFYESARAAEVTYGRAFEECAAPGCTVECTGIEPSSASAAAQQARATSARAQRIWQHCVRPAGNAAVATVNSPLLTALHPGHSSTAVTAMNTCERVDRAQTPTWYGSVDDRD